MASKRTTLKKLIIIIIVALCCTFTFTGAMPAQADELYLGGFPAGFVLDTTTVEVVGMCDVMTENGLSSPARNAGLKTGDIIKSINGKEVTSSNEVTRLLSNLKTAEMEILRDGEQLTLTLYPVKDISSGTMKVGVLVRDSLSGVGTVTYINKTDNTFASLGHPVTDTSGNITTINGGKLYGCIIYDVKRGVRGTPGELKGAFQNNKAIGMAAINSPCGIFGKLDAAYDYTNLTPIAAGDINNVTPGKAEIYSTVASNKRVSYEISIIKVDKDNKDNRNFVIKIDDEDLINITGGIVQGMSGSPIVQNGKLIGAVTHVFVNDPTRGFGISIENMLAAY